jgi:hypothetical protein
MIGSILTVIVLARHAGALAATIGIVVTIALAVTMMRTDWSGVYAHVWFATHESQFVTAQQLARSGAFGPIESWDYYGAALPTSLHGLSVNGRIAAIGTAAGEPVLFVPAYIDIPDDTFGFAHLTGHPETMLDGFGGPVQPRIDLGGGWWWAD